MLLKFKKIVNSLGSALIRLPPILPGPPLFPRYQPPPGWKRVESFQPSENLHCCIPQGRTLLSIVSLLFSFSSSFSFSFYFCLFTPSPAGSSAFYTAYRKTCLKIFLYKREYHQHRYDRYDDHRINNGSRGAERIRRYQRRISRIGDPVHNHFL